MTNFATLYVMIILEKIIMIFKLIEGWFVLARSDLSRKFSNNQSKRTQKKKRGIQSVDPDLGLDSIQYTSQAYYFLDIYLHLCKFA